MAARAMKVAFPNRFARYDLIRCIALASFVHTPSGLSTALWPETYHFETEPQNGPPTNRKSRAGQGFRVPAGNPACAPGNGRTAIVAQS